MNGFSIQQRFFIRLGVVGSPDDAIRSASVDLEEELRVRPHFRTLRVNWENVARRMVVEVEDIGWDANDAADGMAEELFEIVAVVIEKYDSFRIEILDVQPIDGQH